MSVLIGQANVRGSSAIRRDQLEMYIREHKLDIVCLQETFLSPGKEYKVSNGDAYLDVFRADRNRHGGGVAILASAECGAIEVKLPPLSRGTEAIAIEIPLNGGGMLGIASVYHPLGARSMDFGLLDFLEDRYEYLVVAGDLNAKHPNWGVNRISNANGEALVRFLDEASLMQIVENGAATYIDDREGGGCATLDLFLTSLYVASVAEMSVLGDIGSDHLLLCLSVNIDVDQIPTQAPRIHYLFDQAQWSDYAETIARDLSGRVVLPPDIVTPEDLDRAVEVVEQCITTSAHQWIPTRSARGHTKKPLPLHIVRLRERRNRIMRRITRGEVDLKPERNRLRRLIDEEISAFRDRNWLKLCDSIDEHRPYETYGKIQHGMLGGSKRSPALKQDGRICRTPEEKADIFSDHLSRTYRTQESPHFSQAFKVRVEAEVNQNSHMYKPIVGVMLDATDGEQNLDRPIDEREVVSALKGTSNRSPGPDNIYNIMLKKGPDTLLAVLARVFSVCLYLGYTPRRWKQAETVMIPKPGKSLSDPSSYRPISLLSCIAKLLEKIIASRLNDVFEAGGAFSSHQSGFRRGHSANDHLLRLTQTVAEAFNRKHKVYAVFLDVAKAFDTVWHDGLRIKLRQQRYGLPDRMIRFLSDYLDNRAFRVRCGSICSGWKGISAGVPQGGSLSPLLYLMYVNDIPINGDRLSGISQFADDIAIWSASARVNIACQRLQPILNVIVEWCAYWRVTLNSAKSQAIIFGCNRRTVEFANLLEIHDEQIALTNRAKFLGVIFDPRLSFAQHMDYQRKLVKGRLSVLSSVCRVRHGPSVACALRLYMIYIRPVLEYGCPAFFSRISATNQLRLSAIQNKAIRISLRFPRWAPRRQINRLVTLEPIPDRLKALSVNYLAKARIVNPLIEELAAGSGVYVNNNHYRATPVEEILH